MLSMFQSVKEYFMEKMNKIKKVKKRKKKKKKIKKMKRNDLQKSQNGKIKVMN